jgi:hypothetical protein
MTEHIKIDGEIRSTLNSRGEPIASTNISEKHLAVFISLLANKIASMKRELHELGATPEDNLCDGQIDEQYKLQETIEQYNMILDDVREEYEAALTDGINLPSFEVLTRVANPAS